MTLSTYIPSVLLLSFLWFLLNIPIVAAYSLDFRNRLVVLVETPVSSWKRSVLILARTNDSDVPLKGVIVGPDDVYDRTSTIRGGRLPLQRDT